MSLAIVPGSFDPMTLGHLDIVQEAVARYDEVVVAVMINPEKNYLFSLEERVQIAKKTVASLPRVRVISETGMLIDLFERLGADAVCKGWRNQKDYEYEMKMAEWNRAHNPKFRTELIPAQREHFDISSTMVREMMQQDADLNYYLHRDAIAYIREIKK